MKQRNLPKGKQGDANKNHNQNNPHNEEFHKLHYQFQNDHKERSEGLNEPELHEQLDPNEKGNDGKQLLKVDQRQSRLIQLILQSVDLKSPYHVEHKALVGRVILRILVHELV